jgi:hypothetical protein
MRFSSVQKTRLARAARNGCSSISPEYTLQFELLWPRLRGRRPVRAQSAILHKTHTACLVLTVTVFATPNMAGA